MHAPSAVMAQASTGQLRCTCSFARHASLAAAATLSIHVLRSANLRVLRCLAIIFYAVDLPASIVEDLWTSLEALPQCFWP